MATPYYLAATKDSDATLREKYFEKEVALGPHDSFSSEHSLHESILVDPGKTLPDLQSQFDPSSPPEGGDVEKQADVTPPPVSPMHPSQFPDGGREAWLVVLGAMCSLFVSFGWINCIGVFQEYYQTHQLSHLPPSTVSWIPSMETFIMFAGGPFVGRLYDNYGPRYLVLIGSFFHVFGLMMTSISTKYYQFMLAQGICSPLGASMIFYPAFSAVVTWFFKRRALAIGITAAGSSLGGVIMPIMVLKLVAEVGFGWAMRISAFMILGLLVFANLTVKSRLKPHKRPFKLMDFVKPLAELPFALLTLGMFLYMLGVFDPFTFIILQARANGMSASLAGYLVSILNAASVFGRTLPGYIADRYGRFNVMIVVSYFTAVIVLALWIPATGNAAIIVFAVLFGFGSGAFVSMGPALVAQISDVREIGTRTGTLFFVCSFAALVGSPIGGSLVTADHGHFTKLQIFTGCLMMGGSTIFVLCRTSLVGRKMWVKV